MMHENIKSCGYVPCELRVMAFEVEHEFAVCSGGYEVLNVAGTLYNLNSATSGERHGNRNEKMDMWGWGDCEGVEVWE